MKISVYALVDKLENKILVSEDYLPFIFPSLEGAKRVFKKLEKDVGEEFLKGAYIAKLEEV